ncbi:MAG: Rieske 2Fe-2S domain-containing protein [Sandaracinaceae bacterium]
MQSLRPVDPPVRDSLARRARGVRMSPLHWYPAAFSHEVPKKKVLGIRFEGDDLAVYRGEDGVVQVLEDRCPHRQIKLSYGTVEGCTLVCRYHGWTFDRGGSLVGTKHDDFKKKLPVVPIRSYPTRERYGIVWFFPGDARIAELTPLVEIPHGEGDDAWPSITFHYTWRAHHSMVIDNLCNLTHLWVHGSWVPYGDTVLAEHTLVGDKITLLWEHDLRRDVLHPFTSPLFRKHRGSNQSDTSMIYDYPYQSALSNDRVRSTNFMLPMSEDETRVFTLQLWEPPRVPSARLSKVLGKLAMPLIRPVTKEIFRQDGFTVEQEQIAYRRYGDKPLPEPNPAVKKFNELTVKKWEQYEAYAETGRLTEAQMAEQTRVKVL